MVNLTMRFKPYKILWWTIPIIFLPLLLGSESAFDIQLHDSYYVIDSLYLALLISAILLVVGGIYWLLKNYKLINFLSAIHYVLTTMSTFGIAIVSISQTLSRGNNMEYWKPLLSIGLILIGLLVTVQIIFVTNVIIGLFRGKKQ